MRRLAALIDKILDDNRRTALLGCAHMDRLARGGLTSAALANAQDGIRTQRLWVESRIRDLRARTAARNERLARRLARKPALRDLRGPHIALLREQQRVLERQRVILRVIADALAWLALAEDPRVLVPLYKDGKQELPSRVSIARTLLIIRRPVESGEFLVVENDLTRCLGVGDLTVVFANRPWKRPLALEVKTSGRFVEGAQVGIQGIAAQSDHPADAALAAEFYKVAGLRDKPEDVRPRDEPRQTAELLSRAELLYSATEGVEQQLPGLSRRVWRSVSLVVDRAMTDALSWDSVDRGVAVFAVRASDGRPIRDAEALVRERLGDLGFDLNRAVTTTDFLARDAWSTLARPIPLWPVPVRARAALLTGELVFGCVVSRDAWTEAMRQAGLEVEANEDGTWLVHGRSGAATLDAIEVGKLVLGVSLGGVSPREIAERLAASVNGGRS